MDCRYILIAFILNANPILSDNGKDIYVTQTVYGFLDFTTTISNTVMVFSPNSAPAVEKVDIPTNIIETKPYIEKPAEDDNIEPTKATTNESPPANELTEKKEQTSNIVEAQTNESSSIEALRKESSIVEAQKDDSSIVEAQKDESSIAEAQKDRSSNVEAQTSKSNNDENKGEEISIDQTQKHEVNADEAQKPGRYIVEAQKHVNNIVETVTSNSTIVEVQKQEANIVEAEKKPNIVGKQNRKNNKVNVVEAVTSSSVVIAAPASTFDDQPTLQIENNVFEYDLLSRQPTEYAEETYRVINNNPSSKPRNRHNQRRTYESSSEATVVHESTTNKLKTSSAPHNKPQAASGPKGKKPKLRSSTPLRVLKTTSPTLPTSTPQEPKGYRSNGSKKTNSKSYRSNGIGNNNGSGNGNEHEKVSITESVSESPQTGRSHKKSGSRSKPKRKSKHNRSSATHKSAAVVLATTAEPTRKSFRTKVRASSVEDQAASTSIYMFKLNRTPGRWQYTTTPKPRVVIRKNSEDNTTKSVDPFAGNPSLNVISENADLESSGSQNGAVVNNIDQGGDYQHPVETLNVEISTPADFKDTYYELATIKTPYAFQVGGLKKTRFITVTSTIEKTLTPEPTDLPTPDGPLTENILAPSTRIPTLQQDYNVSTLRALHVAENEETPSLETVIDTFSTTTQILRTQVLPIVYDANNETQFLTLTQTYDITNFITVTKTMSPLETDIPLSSFTDFGANLDEAGSEINLELEFGDEDNAENMKAENPNRSNFSDIADLFGKTNGNLTAEDIQKIAMWKLQSSSSQEPQLVQPSPILPSIQQFIPPETTLPFPSIAPSINPFLLPLQQYQTITSSFVHDTLETQLNSKVLKLTFGARTAYTTIFSSAVVPTRATSYITTTIPVQPTPPGFPGYFPPPYPQYYLG